MEQKIRILVVDDDPDIRQLISLLLTSKGYTVLQAASGSEALRMLRLEPACDLAILDIMMPEMDGVAACKAIRKFSTVPILFLTAKTQLDDKVDAYSSGGDDFMPKPFSPTELLVKVDSLLRRYRTYKGKKEQLEGVAIQLDEDHRCVTKDDKIIELTAKEYEIIRYLFLHQGRVVSIRELYEDAWGEKYLPSSTNTVMVHILNLRKKLEDDHANPKLIRTVWGKGYQFG